jgi:hypothetical protein
MFSQLTNDTNMNNTLTTHVQGRWWLSGKMEQAQTK